MISSTEIHIWPVFLDFGLTNLWVQITSVMFTLYLYFARTSLKLRDHPERYGHTLLRNYQNYNLSLKVSLIHEDPFSIPFLCNLKHIYFIQNSMKISSKKFIPFKAAIFFEKLSLCFEWFSKFQDTDFSVEGSCFQAILRLLVIMCLSIIQLYIFPN